MKESMIKADTTEQKITEFLEQMSLEEKIGQLNLINSDVGTINSKTRDALQKGKIGGILNEVDRDTIVELQKIALQESRLGIPLLIGRDVIHGFNTIFPIPLGLATTWNEEVGMLCGQVSAREASAVGINWTYAPMVDICRDPRWGRIAESFGEDPYLSSRFAVAMVKGFQGKRLDSPDSIAACVKHFAGYGACESGKDYNTTNIPENELRNVHLPPFKAAIDAGAVSIMTSFSDIDGIPASANHFLLQTILRDEWKFDGFVVSDWGSISQLAVHGLAKDDKGAAYEAANAGVDMDMSSTTYSQHLAQLVEDKQLTVEQIDSMVSNILRIKFQLGLFENPVYEQRAVPVSIHQELVKEAALQSIVLLKNSNNILPLDKEKNSSIAVIGPMADEPNEQLGTWVFDGNVSLSKTPLEALRESLTGAESITYIRGLLSTRSHNKEYFTDAVEVVKNSDIALLFLGEEAILSGEAHCRADIRLPGAQEALIDAVSKTGKPIVLVLMAGRPLLLEHIIDKVDAILYAWHPGSLGGSAITDLLLGMESPSGKLPVTFPRVTGQIPIYYSHKNTGRPATPESIIHIDDIDIGAEQHSLGHTSFHLDTPNSPLFPFGFGLSYTTFAYDNLQLSSNVIEIGGSFTVSVELSNTGTYEAYETVQLYIRDLVGSVTRPVKELKKFKKLRFKPGQTEIVQFELSTDDLSFYGRENKLVCEPGTFKLWVGGSSDTGLETEFELI